MVFENIERLKREYTDKLVVIDETRPELLRFKGMTGTVRTVNMSGRALVEFDGRNNIGWYDIDVDFLKVIDAPLPKPEAKSEEKAKPAAKAAPASQKGPSALEKARGETPAAKKAAPGGAGMSMADILAAARSGKTPAAAGKTPAAASKPADQPAAPAKPAAADPKQMSVAEMLAAARGEKAGAAPAPADDTTTAPETAGLTAEQQAVAAKMQAARTAKAAAESSPTEPAAKPAKRDPKSMSVADMLAAARGEKSGPAADAPSTPPAAETISEIEAQAAEQAEPVVVDPVPAAAEPSPSEAARPATTDLPTDTAGIVAYCRQVDAS